MDIARMIKVWGYDKSLNQTQLAGHLGITREAVQKMIKANRCDTNRLEAMAEFYGVDLITFMKEGV